MDYYTNLLECIDKNTKNKIIILDETFPNMASGFRIAEYSYYLKHYLNSETYSYIGSPYFEQYKSEYAKYYPKLAYRVNQFNPDVDFSCSLFYMVFLRNAYMFLPLIEQYKTPFIFTLYPGGDFAINNAESDMKLKKVLNSQYLKKIIVTQQITYDYLIKNKFCSAELIEFIFGGVVPVSEDTKVKFYEKVRYGFEKNKLDICFFAYKYTKYGEDKGYDVFIDVAKILIRKYPNIYFHVAGGYDENVIDISDIKSNITFYGKLKIEEFDSFFIDKDIVLSPNINDRLSPGAFDGFPTGSCVEAGIRKTAIFCTDPLNSNRDRLIDAKEIVIIPHDSKEISNIIDYYYNNFRLLKELGDSCQTKLLSLLNYEAQIIPRLALIDKEMKN